MQGACHLQQDEDRDVADAVFEIREVAFGDVGGACHRLARQSAPRTQVAHALAEGDEEGVLLVDRRGCRVRRGTLRALIRSQLEDSA